MPHDGLSEHDNLNSVSSQCARGKLSTARKPEIHQKVNFVSVFNALNNTKSKETHITPHRENFINLPR